MGPEAEFFAFLREGKFMLQRLTASGRHVFYPRHPAGGEAWEWVEASGQGTVYSATAVREKPERGGDYCIAIIELAEGPRMMARVIDATAGRISIGMPVVASVEKPAWDWTESPVVVFRLASAAVAHHA